MRLLFRPMQMIPVHRIHRRRTGAIHRFPKAHGNTKLLRERPRSPIRLRKLVRVQLPVMLLIVHTHSIHGSPVPRCSTRYRFRRRPPSRRITNRSVTPWDLLMMVLDMFKARCTIPTAISELTRLRTRATIPRLHHRTRRIRISPHRLNHPPTSSTPRSLVR